MRFMEIIKKFDYDSIVAVYSENKPSREHFLALTNRLEFLFI